VDWVVAKDVSTLTAKEGNSSALAVFPAVLLCILYHDTGRKRTIEPPHLMVGGFQCGYEKAHCGVQLGYQILCWWRFEDLGAKGREEETLFTFAHRLDMHVMWWLG